MKFLIFSFVYSLLVCKINCLKFKLFSLSLQARDKLMQENAKLKAILETNKDQIMTLKGHLGMIRKNTIAFILEQMDALNIQRDTEV